jgi:hypothetical protein
MGLGAFVRCRCFEEGKTIEPPFPREELMIDDEGNIGLREAYEAYKTMPYDDYDSKYGDVDDILYEWQCGCCEHEDSEYCSESIGNWYGVRRFEGIIGNMGKEHFPVLSTLIPRGNGGIFPREKAEAALAEITLLEEMLTEAAEVCLVDVNTEETVYSFISAWDGVFAYSWDQHIGIDPQGLFVVDPRTGKEVFRATHVRQTVCQDTDGKQTPALLTCLATGAEQRVFCAIGNDQKDREMKIEVLCVDVESLHAPHAISQF